MIKKKEKKILGTFTVVGPYHSISCLESFPVNVDCHHRISNGSRIVGQSFNRNIESQSLVFFL